MSLAAGMRRALALAALPVWAAVSPALAAEAEAETDVPERQIVLLVYGEDACPQSSDDEIVVCARRPEEERYRIPPRLRDGNRPAEIAWGARVEALDEISRDTRPDSCSVVGSYGQSGCSQQLIRQWQADRRGRPAGR